MEENLQEEGLQKDNELIRFRNNIGAVRQEIKKILVGQDQLIDLMLVSLFTQGHILLEGVPGLAKTMGAKLFAQTLSVKYSRVQFTPDLMPSDVVGTSVFNMKDSEFKFNAGPVFANIVLIDEINRAPAKTQSALFEVMEERQITVDGTTYPMDFPFMIIATQNPIEQEGTYKLPEAQLDRFLFKIKLDYPGLNDEKTILRRFRTDFSLELMKAVKSVLKKNDIKEAGSLIENVHIKDEILDYIAEIVHDTRNNGDLFLGASPRASLALMRAAKAVAAINARDFVIPDDVKFVAKAVLNHRIILNPDRELEGIEPEDVIDEIIKKVEVPR
ncbi:MoxR family ATPase [Fulvivirga kasyanovii]|uniref:MoxR family ATPase n=1 Tax=Fulvivirga kasyanovii TaxID=396812 RepID=A0ABW9RNY6_9BACT|nr:MoxR family ATPase [Fulvivirga kasyanovii]MTI25854.1 MoxR family ATPase [Fulvivirga kasyanovii]